MQGVLKSMHFSACLECLCSRRAVCNE